MKTSSLLCDGCGEPINPDSGMLEFRPLRGGLDLVLTGVKPTDEKQPTTVYVHTLNKHLHFHPGPVCLDKLLEKVVADADKKLAEAAAKKEAAKKAAATE